jgi:hypothetical protein
VELFLIKFHELLKSYNEAYALRSGSAAAEASPKLQSFQHQYDNFQK